MDEGELDKQFQEMEGDKQVQAAAAGTPEAPTVAKRATVASVKKDLDELRQDVERDVLDWLGQLDVRLEDAEKRTIKHNETLLGDVKARLDIIEKGEPKTIIEVADNTIHRIETLEEATGAIADALRYHIKYAEAKPPEAAAAAEYGKTPTQPEEPVKIGFDLQAVAAKCQTMTDVLMICRALKDDPTLTDAERNNLLKIATGAAGVQFAQGLQIRAGVRNVAG